MAELGIRNVRNFWLTAQADGGSPVTLGPKAKTGGLEATLLLRERGEVSNDKVEIWSHVLGALENSLVTEIKVPAGAVIEQHEDGSATITIRKER
jgi:hypothetical protein